jgi:hypothetical protein
VDDRPAQWTAFAKSRAAVESGPHAGPRTSTLNIHQVDTAQIAAENSQGGKGNHTVGPRKEKGAIPAKEKRP